MASFDRSPDGIMARLDEEEARLLKRLAEEMRMLLDSGRQDDPVLGRLFPEAYESPEDSSKFREMVASELDASKRESLAAIDEVVRAETAVERVLSNEQAESWLAALTDMRLAIGTRLEVDEDKMAAELDPDDPDAAALGVLHWLGWVQESILRAMEVP